MPAPDEVEVDVEYSLAGVPVRIEDRPETSGGNTAFCGDDRCASHNFPNRRVIVRR